MKIKLTLPYISADKMYNTLYIQVLVDLTFEEKKIRRLKIIENRKLYLKYKYINNKKIKGFIMKNEIVIAERFLLFQIVIKKILIIYERIFLFFVLICFRKQKAFFARFIYSNILQKIFYKNQIIIELIKVVFSHRKPLSNQIMRQNVNTLLISKNNKTSLLHKIFESLPFFSPHLKSIYF